jgi:hypothetical protein
MVGDVRGGVILIVVGLAFSWITIHELRSGEMDRLSREQFEWHKPLYVIQTYSERRARILPIIFILMSLSSVVGGILMVIEGL